MRRRREGSAEAVLVDGDGMGAEEPAAAVVGEGVREGGGNNAEGALEVGEAEDDSRTKTHFRRTPPSSVPAPETP